MNSLGVLFSTSKLVIFYNFNCFLLLFISMFIILNLFFLLNINFYQKLMLSYQTIELYCCLFPLLILIFQMVPSLVILWKSSYMNLNPNLTIKITGHQWYWTYEIGDMLGLEFDSYMKSKDMLILGDFMLMDVDNRLIVPYMIPIRFVMTSSDVLHSWALPSFFLKLDVMSGVLSVMDVNFDSLGIFYGQCSEICGANHSFMPIVMEVTLFDFFKTWLLSL